MLPGWKISERAMTVSGLILDACFFHGMEHLPAYPYQVCFECGHCFATADILLKEDNIVRTNLGLSPVTRVEQVSCCPMCTHSW